MPILAKSSSGTVTGLWGSAFVRLPSGKLKPLAVGDHVKPGEHIVTTQDGIVQISPPKGKPVEVKPNLAKPAHTELAGKGDVDQTIAALERGDDDAATAAGLNGGASGGFLPGLRVDRVVEQVGQLEFQYETARTPFATPIAVATQPLFFAESPTGVDTPVIPVAAPQVSIQGNVSGLEGGEAVFVITLSKPSPTDVVVLVSTVNGTASDDDFGGAPGGVPVTIPAGQTSVTVPVSLFQDDAIESDESFTLKIDAVESGNATIGNASAVGNILDLPAVTSVSSPSVTEGADLTFTVTLAHSSPVALPVTLSLASGTADVGVDTPRTVEVSTDGGNTFKSVPLGADGSFDVTLPAGKSDLLVKVPTTQDGSYEDQETITLTASTPGNGGTPAEGAGTIVD